LKDDKQKFYSHQIGNTFLNLLAVKSKYNSGDIINDLKNYNTRPTTIADMVIKRIYETDPNNGVCTLLMPMKILLK
jgi:hypothetical protein